MSTLYKECKIFDPVNISVSTVAERFIIDTWHTQGLMQVSLFHNLPDVYPIGKTQVMLSSGMYIDCPLVRVGVQIGNIKALPVEFALVDDGAAPLLFGSNFIEKLFDMRAKGITDIDDNSADTSVSIDSPEKYDPDSLGIRLIPEGQTIDALQLERFLRSVRTIHNIGVIACDQLHQHNDWQGDNAKRKVIAVLNTITKDDYLYNENTLHINWIENGSIWLSLKSGSKYAISWLSQLFEKTTDARLRKTIAETASAEEDALIKSLTRNEIAHAKAWEQRRAAAKHIKETRKDWQQTILNEIDFKAKLIDKISDPEIRAEAEKQIDQALSDLINSDFLPVVENIPIIEASKQDIFLTRRQNSAS